METRHIRFSDEVEREIEKCPHRFGWTSDPNDPCATCNYRAYCKSKFYDTQEIHIFKHDQETLKKEFKEKLRREEGIGSVVPTGGLD